MSARAWLAAFTFVASCAGTAQAVIIETVPNDDFPTIQSAIDEAAADSGGGVITVKRGTYTTSVTLRPNVTLQGEETAKTILSGGLTADRGGRKTASWTRWRMSGTSPRTR